MLGKITRPILRRRVDLRVLSRPILPRSRRKCDHESSTFLEERICSPWRRSSRRHVFLSQWTPPRCTSRQQCRRRKWFFSVRRIHFTGDRERVPHLSCKENREPL